MSPKCFRFPRSGAATGGPTSGRWRDRFAGTKSGRAAAVLVALFVSSAPAQESPAAKPNAGIKLDKDSFIFQRIEDGRPPRAEDNPEECRAYNHVLLHARRFPQSDLNAAARRDVTFRDLVVDTRADFRLDLVYFEGRLLRSRAVKPTDGLKEAGVPTLYESWVFPGRSEVPICVLTTEKPDGLEPSLKYDPARQVAVAGYYFKLLRYDADDPDPKGRMRLAPLLMARSLTLLPAPTAGGSGAGDNGETILFGVVGLGASAAAVLFGLMWYFRRGDLAHRRATASRRERNNPFAAET